MTMQQVSCSQIAHARHIARVQQSFFCSSQGGGEQSFSLVFHPAAPRLHCNHPQHRVAAAVRRGSATLPLSCCSLLQQLLPTLFPYDLTTVLNSWQQHRDVQRPIHFTTQLLCAARRQGLQQLLPVL
jgi:hypothetical protein